MWRTAFVDRVLPAQDEIGIRSINIIGAHCGRQVAAPVADNGGRRSSRHDGDDRATSGPSSRHVRDHPVQRQVAVKQYSPPLVPSYLGCGNASLDRAVRLCWPAHHP